MGVREMDAAPRKNFRVSAQLLGAPQSVLGEMEKCPDQIFGLFAPNSAREQWGWRGAERRSGLAHF